MAKRDIKREAKETAVIIEDALRSIASRIGDIFSEALDETNTVAEAMAKDVTSSLNSLAKVSNELATSYQKAYEGAYKQADLQKTINNRKAKEFAIRAKIEAVARNTTLSDEEQVELKKKLNAELEDAVGYNKDLEKSLQKQVDISKNINKAMGFTGGALKGLKKLAGGIGLDNLEDVFADAEAASLKMANQVTNDGENIAGLGGKIKVAWEGVSTALGGIAEALTDPLFIITAIVKSIKFLVGIFDHVLKLTRDVGQAFGVAGANASRIKMELHAAGDASGDIYYFTEELLEATIQLNKVAGQNLAVNVENAKTFQDLSLYSGLSVENVGALYKLSLETGTPFQNMYEQVRGTTEELNKGTNFAMSTSDAIERISNASASVRFNIKGGTEGLVQAAHTAARLGTTMDEIAAAAESHLDFESSIGKEIEAEMFLQKDLNLEKLRMAALTGDTTTQAAEQERLIRENMGSLEGNVLAQQAFADALGISKESLQEQMLTLEKNKNLSEEEKQIKQDTAEAMAQQGKDAVAFDRKMQSAVKQLKAALEPLAKAVGEIALFLTNLLVPMITPILKFLGTNTGKILLGVAGAFYAIKGAKSLFTKFTSMFSGNNPVSNLTKQGATPNNPLFTYNVNESGGGMDMDFSRGIKGNIFKYLGKKGGLTRTFQRAALKAFGKGKFGKILYNGIGKAGSTKIASFIGKPIGTQLAKIIPTSATNLTKNFGTNNMAKIAKMSKTGRFAKGTVIDGVKVGGRFMNAQTTGKAGNIASKFIPGLKTTSAGLGTGTKVMSGLAKTAKVLGPIGAAADLVIGGFTGASQADLSAEEQRAAGVREGIGKGEATTLGVLTGGAEKGSMFTEMLGGEKGSAGDEMLGIGMAAGRGALAGAAIGSVIPVVGTAVGGAVGAVVGTVAEGFKVFSDPNSSLRQGITNFAESASEKISGWASSAGETISGWASSAGETLSGWGTSAKESITSFAVDSFDSVKSLASGAKDVASDAYNYVKDSSFGKAVSSVGSTISSAASTAASYLNPFSYFANGGIVTRPTMGIIGEGGQSEAVIPLNRAGEFGIGGNQEVVALLKTLISEVKKGGDVYLDGNKVGYSLALQSSQMG